MLQSRLALCLTPDAAFFKPAIATALSILDQPDSEALDVIVLCDAADVPRDFDALGAETRRRIALQIVDWPKYTAGLPVRGHFSSAVHRRLALHRVLPARYERYISMDADMLAIRGGLSLLAELDLGEAPLAAAIDMIVWKDVDGGPQTDEFQRYRRRLGLEPSDLYFNNGFALVDRHRWETMDIAGEAIRILHDDPEACPYLEQSALNAVIKGRFAPLSPRFNYMGDFLRLDLEREIAPIVLHFVNRPKPFESHWGGDPRFRDMYRAYFQRTPWPDAVGHDADAMVSPFEPFDPIGFRERLMAQLGAMRFADGWTMPVTA